MQPLDPERYAYALAGLMLAGEWEVTAFRAAVGLAAGDRRVLVPRLADRTTAAFPVTPTFAALADFLFADAGVRRAIARSVARPTPGGRRRRTAPALPPGWIGDAKLPLLQTPAALATWMGITPGRLFWLADLAGRNRKHPPGPLRTYRYRWILKRGGSGPRLLEIPVPRLKRLQRRVLDEILAAVPVHPAAHGFVPGRSVVTNARPHCGKAVVLRFDLTDFFPSVSAARVTRTFRAVGHPPAVARLLAGLCTTRLPPDAWSDRPAAAWDRSDDAARRRLLARHLPQGAPTSPALANLAAHRLDRRLARLAVRLGADYTRYADDITFSGTASLARSRVRLAALVAAIVADEGFSLHHRKTRVMRRGDCQRVAGVVVNVRPNVPRAAYDLLKAVLTNCGRHGPASQNRAGHADFRAHLLGRVAQVAAVNPARGGRLATLFRRIRWDADPSS